MSGSEPMKTGSPRSRNGSTVRERRLADLQPGEVLGRVADPCDDLERHRVAAPRGERVDVERERRAGLGGGQEVGRQRIGIEREVGRRDDRDGIGRDLAGVRGEHHRLGGRLRPAVDDQPAPNRGAKDDRRPLPFVGAEQDPLAGGAAGEDSVGAALLEEADHRPDRGLVERIAAGGQRRRGSDDERRAFGHRRKGSGFALVAAQAAG